MRAKKKLIIIGDIEALKFACQNNIADIRKTTIIERLNNYINEK